MPTINSFAFATVAHCRITATVKKQTKKGRTVRRTNKGRTNALCAKIGTTAIRVSRGSAGGGEGEVVTQ